MDFELMPCAVKSSIIGAAEELRSLYVITADAIRLEVAVTKLITLFNRDVLSWPISRQGQLYRRLDFALYIGKLGVITNLPSVVNKALAFSCKFVVVEIQRGLEDARPDRIACVVCRFSFTSIWLSVLQKHCRCFLPARAGVVFDRREIIGCCADGWVVISAGAQSLPPIWRHLDIHRREAYSYAFVFCRLRTIKQAHRALYIVADYRPSLNPITEIIASDYEGVGIVTPYHRIYAKDVP